MKSTPNPLARRFPLGFFARLPREAGVYFMRSAKGEILYVGKAKNLRSRLLSYRYARGGSVGDNIVALLEHVRKIDWELCESEARAAARERELIRALVPRYNVADAWEEDYLYIGLRCTRGTEGLAFRLTDREAAHEGFRLHRCFRHRRLTKDAYSALLRLLWACTNRESRFAMPSTLCRRSPAYEFEMRVAGAARWRRLLTAFLGGENRRLLSAFVQALLENPAVPAYARPALQRDLRTLERFAELGTCQGEALVTHQQMRRSIRVSVDEAIARNAA